MLRRDHLLCILGEECGEVAQRTSKAQRFGLTEIQPGQHYDNAARIIHEYADVIALYEMLRDEGHLNENLEEQRRLIAAKKIKVEQFLLLSRDCGRLTPENSSENEPAIQ